MYFLSPDQQGQSTEGIKKTGTAGQTQMVKQYRTLYAVRADAQ